ncbi:MAG: hypothetical protein Q9198_006294 [Flavoplaca austrocitrina]
MGDHVCAKVPTPQPARGDLPKGLLLELMLPLQVSIHWLDHWDRVTDNPFLG